MYFLGSPIAYVPRYREHFTFISEKISENVINIKNKNISISARNIIHLNPFSQNLRGHVKKNPDVDNPNIWIKKGNSGFYYT